LTQIDHGRAQRFKGRLGAAVPRAGELGLDLGQQRLRRGPPDDVAIDQHQEPALPRLRSDCNMSGRVWR
jgi:hypothetical protein